MPILKYALKPNEPKRLEISWKGFWKEVKIILDGNEIGTFENMSDLKKGKEFSLKDKSILKVELSTKFGQSGLHVLLNNEPLPGSTGDPEQRFKLAYGMIFFIGILNLVLGMLAYFFNITFLKEIGVGLFSIIYGIAFVILGLLVQRTKSMIALALAIGIHILDGIVGMVLTINAGGRSPSSGIIVRVALIIPMIQGFSAIKKLKEQKRNLNMPK